MAIRFIEDSLFCTTPFALSYTDPDQKWIIRQHLLSLFQDFPSLKPDVGVFTHNNGTEVNLLYANGELPVARPAPDVPLTIWLHELYPHMAPIVYVNLADSVYPIYENHPFVDSSGSVTTSYLETWQFRNCNLSDLANNLIRLFTQNHPFYYSGSQSNNCSHPSTVSRMEAMDRLAAAIYYDAAAITAETGQETKNFSGIEAELRRRAKALENMIRGLEEEKKGLKKRSKELWDESDKLWNWLKVYDKGSAHVSAIDDAFEAVDRESEIVAELSAADLAAEDLMYAVDKAFERGVLGFEAYMKQVRTMARQQFLVRAKMVKFERSK